MTRILFFSFLLVGLRLSAQDRILTLAGDTLVAKITAVDKSKVTYQLAASTDKAVMEIPLSSLHKILWRSGMAYIINQGQEDRLQKANPNTVVQASPKPAPQPQVVPPLAATPKLQTAANAPTSTPHPELRVRRWVLWRTYTVNGTRVKRDRMERTLAEHDWESGQVFQRGNALRSNGSRMSWLSTATAMGVSLLPIPILPPLILLGATTTNTVGNIKVIKGRHIMRKAVVAYENKRKSGSIKPRFAQNTKI